MESLSYLSIPPLEFASKMEQEIKTTQDELEQLKNGLISYEKPKRHYELSELEKNSSILERITELWKMNKRHYKKKYQLLVKENPWKDSIKSKKFELDLEKLKTGERTKSWTQEQIKFRENWCCQLYYRLIIGSWWQPNFSRAGSLGLKNVECQWLNQEFINAISNATISKLSPDHVFSSDGTLFTFRFTVVHYKLQRLFNPNSLTSIKNWETFSKKMEIFKNEFKQNNANYENLIKEIDNISLAYYKLKHWNQIHLREQYNDYLSQKSETYRHLVLSILGITPEIELPNLDKPTNIDNSDLLKEEITQKLFQSAKETILDLEKKNSELTENLKQKDHELIEAKEKLRIFNETIEKFAIEKLNFAQKELATAKEYVKKLEEEKVELIKQLEQKDNELKDANDKLRLAKEKIEKLEEEQTKIQKEKQKLEELLKSNSKPLPQGQLFAALREKDEEIKKLQRKIEQDRLNQSLRANAMPARTFEPSEYTEVKKQPLPVIESKVNPNLESPSIPETAKEVQKTQQKIPMITPIVDDDNEQNNSDWSSEGSGEENPDRFNNVLEGLEDSASSSSDEEGRKIEFDFARHADELEIGDFGENPLAREVLMRKHNLRSTEKNSSTNSSNTKDSSDIGFIYDRIKNLET